MASPAPRTHRRRPTPPAQALIPSWVRIVTVLFTLPVWAAVVLWSMLVDHRLPDTAMMMIPSAIIVAVAPAWRRPRASADGSTGEQPAEGEV